MVAVRGAPSRLADAMRKTRHPADASVDAYFRTGVGREGGRRLEGVPMMQLQLIKVSQLWSRPPLGGAANQQSLYY